MEESFTNKTILITGGAGFIGSNIALHLEEVYPQSKVVVFDLFRNGETFENGNLRSFGHYKNLIGFKGDIICGDITNSADLGTLNSYQFDYIFHLAAISDTRVYDQEAIMRTNVNSFHRILEITRSHGAKLVYASSAATYGSSPSPQKIGDDAPENTYGFSKYAMDQMAKTYSLAYPKMHIVGLKYFNVYGEGEYYKNKTSSMVIQLAHQILAGKSPRLFIGSDKIMRDFVYIKDVITANILACSTNKNGIYNIGSGISRSFYDIAHILQQELNNHTEIDYFENPYTAYQTDTRADISLSQKFLGYQPKYTLEQGISDYIPYIKQTFNWSNK
ncbi:ADP-glyceromanno-heptose 6-epimerase [Spongiimicrobium salis]|uniref:ADP-glyceromanno-heptose 6-epimerase n=1 Tax=Spongiimicrobium salis TaxID=1667022 RepID=UPI00374D1B98